MHNVTVVEDLHSLLQALVEASVAHYMSIALAQGGAISYNRYCDTMRKHDDAQYNIDRYFMRRLQEVRIGLE